MTQRRGDDVTLVARFEHFPFEASDKRIDFNPLGGRLQVTARDTAISACLIASPYKVRVHPLFMPECVVAVWRAIMKDGRRWN